MMNVIRHPGRNEWKRILERPAFDAKTLQQKVSAILEDVKSGGDASVRKYTQLFDGYEMGDLKVSQAEITTAAARISEALKQSINLAVSNITKFHIAQLSQEANVIETMPGVECWQRNLPIDKAGLYIPGGTAPLFSTLMMLGIPAKIAGCRQVVLCTPADKQGNIHPAILYTASVLGLTDIYKAGGVQAIAAMAYGTETIPQVYKIFGPGNQYVTTAKQLVQYDGVAIDMPAGPSELCIIADDTADPAYLAADLLSQAEHGPDSQVLLVTTSEQLPAKVMVQLADQLKTLPRQEIAAAALKNSKIVIVADIAIAIDMVNEYAPEHLIICCSDEHYVTRLIINAGSVFIGNYSPESAGDYASGTNHTLPTNGYARAYSGVSVDSFVKKISYQRITKTGLESLAAAIVNMAEAEGLQAHANAVKIRL
jgi:histidinol dehydrogenase